MRLIKRNSHSLKQLAVFILILFLFLFINNSIFGQDSKPKVALVLSGGGAKGIAHIPVLQALDSLSIVPDLVVGTSMGSIVGGLYAMGYSGDSIASIASSVNWDELLSNDIPFTDIGIEEKSEYNRYLFDFNLVKGKPKFGDALLKDQNIRELFAQITVPGININNFDSLSIPYRAIATDIANGQEVVIKDGPLYMAMRASLAIPSVFSPVESDSMLLVDGGVVNNFPTDVAEEMGADIIIGSVVSDGMQPKEELKDVAAILFQTGMLTSNLKNPANLARCDILIDHVPHLTYSTGDFSKSDLIYQEGKIATEETINELVALKEQVKGYKQLDHRLPELNKTYILDSISYTGISEGNLDLFKSRVNLKTNTPYTVEDVIHSVDNAMGTNMFDQISFRAFHYGDKTAMQFEGHERTKAVLKGSLHYDTEQGVGLLANITTRNLIGKASRTLASLDFSEVPKFRIQHQKYFGKTKNWWWRSEIFGQRLKQNVFIRGNKADNFVHHYFQFDNQVNRNINFSHSYIGAGINYEYTNVKPDIDPEVSENALSLDKYQFNHLELNVHYLLNTLSDPFYPERGTFFKAKVGRGLVQSANLEYSHDTIPGRKGETNGFTRLNLNFDQRIPIGKNISGILQASVGFTFMDDLKSGQVDLPDVGYGVNYVLGGNLQRPRKNTYAFRGLRDAELVVTQFMMLNLAVQFNPVSNMYFTPHVNMATVGHDDFDQYISDAFTPTGRWSEELDISGVVSAGATMSYKSFLGPIDLDVSWVNDINKFRVFLGIGYQFNRSN